MQIKATLAPGQNGTKQLHKPYGDQLVCVRYRYDKARQKRLKTVELIVDEQDWVPGVNIPADRRVALKIGFGETELRERLKKAGGYWNPAKKAWILSYHKVLQMGLERRMIDERRLFPIFFIVAGALLLVFTYMTDSHGKALFFAVPATIFVILINIYRVRFCDACGEINYSTNSLKRPNYCIECGEKLV